MRSGTTERLTIEPLDLSHAVDLFAALDDDRVGTYIGGPDVTSLAALRERIARLNVGAPADRSEIWCNWAVLSEGVVVGRIEATVHDGIAEIAYVFGPMSWGKGYASEAVAWMVEELRTLGAQECWAAVAPGNESSVRLLARVGFMAADPSDVRLLSYEDGDLTFLRR
jgi:RimJ/RimL family protein N-acetyltransferase